MQANIQTEDRALHYAIYNQNIDVIQHLLELGADVNLPNIRGITPLDLAKKVENKEIVALIRKAAEKQMVKEEKKIEEDTEKQTRINEILEELYRSYTTIGDPAESKICPKVQIQFNYLKEGIPLVNKEQEDVNGSKTAAPKDIKI